jgi:methyltransferase (TIGR00027 family)
VELRCERQDLVTESADWSVANGVGFTALIVAAARAVESRRASPLQWPGGVTVYEVDAPLVLSFKEKVLAGGGARARSGRHVVAADLRADWPTALRGAGFDLAQPTAWLAEGLFMFLPDEAKVGLLATVQALSALGRQVALDHITLLRADVESSAAFREAAERTDSDVDIDILSPEEQDHDLVAWPRA